MCVFSCKVWRIRRGHAIYLYCYVYVMRLNTIAVREIDKSLCAPLNSSQINSHEGEPFVFCVASASFGPSQCVVAQSNTISIEHQYTHSHVHTPRKVHQPFDWKATANSNYYIIWWLFEIKNLARSHQTLGSVGLQFVMKNLMISAWFIWDEVRYSEHFFLLSSSSLLDMGARFFSSPLCKSLQPDFPVSFFPPHVRHAPL